MSTIAHTWRWVTAWRRQPAPAASPRQEEPPAGEPLAFDFAPHDPILAYFQSAGGAVNIDTLALASPGRDALRAAGVKLVVPLVSQGELLGLLSLGERRSGQEYSSDDRQLLERLAVQAAPAVRVAQLVREQQAEARSRERIEHELQVARLIQQHFLPQGVPQLDGWELGAYYRPARDVSGDFYDFIPLPNGQLGIVIGDVTDKGVPAALVMAATRSVLRATAQRLIMPGDVLREVNDLVCPETPPNMFVTCLYAVLDPSSGKLCYANAGHDLPYVRSSNGVRDLQARGMPLGLMRDMEYEQMETQIRPDEDVIFYSDGLVEAHDRHRDMFGFPRLRNVLAAYSGQGGLVSVLLDELDRFTGQGWEQEDDVTLVTLRRLSAAAADAPERLLSDFTLASKPGNERQAMARVADDVQPLGLPAERLECLKTAVAEATMNAIEHGNHNRPELLVRIRVYHGDGRLIVRVTDQGAGPPIPSTPTEPNLDAKLAGLEDPRGWGLYLMRQMVDELRVSSDRDGHTVELVLHVGSEGGADARNSV